MNRLSYPVILSALLALSACSGGRGTSAVPTLIPAPSSQAEVESCDTPLFPVVQGATWNYTMSGATTGTYARTITSVEPDRFTDQEVFSTGGNRIGKWDCDDGSVVALQPDAALSASTEAQGLRADFHVVESSGVTVPDNLNPGAYWNQELRLEGEGAVKDVQVKANNAVTRECTAANVETVTVPAGTFQALRADCKTGQKLTLNGNTLLNELKLTSTVWFAQDVGVVRKVESLDGGPVTTIELTSYKIP